jgi:hypothetical protein
MKCASLENLLTNVRTTDAWKSFHEIHCDINPNGRGNFQRLQGTNRVQVFSFILLTSDACTNMILNELVGA